MKNKQAKQMMFDKGILDVPKLLEIYISNVVKGRISGKGVPFKEGTEVLEKVTNNVYIKAKSKGWMK